MFSKDELENLGILEYLFNKKITKEEEYFEIKNKILSKLENKMRE